MHILYNLPSVYDNINDQYMKELDNEKDIQLEDLRADLRRKYDRLLDQGNIEKTEEDNDEKIIKEEKALKTGFKKTVQGKMSRLWKNWSQRCRLLDFGSEQGQATCK